ncbi:hypothetical protein [Burkholderia pseudomallei]|uniref:hypothetical protein n=1 Tax=Burkholderia pseudomallei TaxID=28450 RepID=UPI000F08F8BB|nr:hypothetical protein [Burkholderia pseudomallei]CAJ2864720.1 Uncharacterised protein [Burkholderia pseudomallei]VCC54072.1 Uncharacterised protein [Burkholderia pseudomallei]VCD11806.1 Uncharacterised protein [Burkholderia pseudomallei]VCR55547.1 Uncharacterised protein [Burkholderia pseudomallei]VCR56118.1 Uncharacterised protein [Burkholderia pseudomallei]
MNIDRILTICSKIVDSPAGGALCLSKGGWEGWLQCELWREINIEHRTPAEREVAYPAPNAESRCDLVVEAAQNDRQIWIEIKVYSIYRAGEAAQFVDSVTADLRKLDRAPPGVKTLLLVVVPRSIGGEVHRVLDVGGLNLNSFLTINTVLLWI